MRVVYENKRDKPGEQRTKHYTICGAPDEVEIEVNGLQDVHEQMRTVRRVVSCKRIPG